ncbi:MAG: radical SAM family heme chaperone HemW [Candidatus Melainabacteria bacterium]|nr:radical SAM family heme chaperone HemW [Candidatus Melainabacteria bacterium]
MIQAAYIHLPFCVHKCDFCDFAAFAGVQHVEREYCEILLEEIKQRLKQTQAQIKLDSIFYGGGTPSVVTPENMRFIHQGLLDLVECSNDAEISMESTPHSITKEKCAFWRELGINRISIGIESLSDGELRAIGRDHTVAQAYEGIEIACQADFPVVSLDFMYCLPTQTLDSWQKTLDQFVELASTMKQIRHVSAYGLELVGNSPLYSRFPKDSVAYPDDETFNAMRDSLIETLARAGFEQYEVSNFARPGYACRHNMTYWRNAEYLAFGVGAHRYVDGVRSSNLKSLTRYIREPLSVDLFEPIDQATRQKEAIMLGFRMLEGINLRDFKNEYGVDLFVQFEKPIKRMLEQGMLKLENGHLSIPQKQLALSNSVIAEFM